jgi:predicted ArsR family transcriptional regulator
MKSTRERILQILLNNPQSSINEIADSVKINAISARHHLTNLLADGLIKAEEVRHGVGRPKLVYSLTDAGAERFPTRYLSLSNRLVNQLKSQLSPKDLESFFALIAQDIASGHTEKTRSMNIEEKLEYIQAILSPEGYSMEWTKEGDNFLINEISCPFFHVSKNHPEICAIDQVLLSNLLSIPVEKIGCLNTGDHQCTFVIKNQNQPAR